MLPSGCDLNAPLAVWAEASVDDARKKTATHPAHSLGMRTPEMTAAVYLGQLMWSMVRSRTQGFHIVGTRQVVDVVAEHAPIAFRLRPVLAARQDLVDLPRVVHDVFHLCLRLEPLVGGVELATQPVR